MNKDTRQIKLFRTVRMSDARSRIDLRKMSRKRFIGAAMYFGMSARDAADVAIYVRNKGISYTRATAYLLIMMEEQEDSPNQALIDLLKNLADIH